MGFVERLDALRAMVDSGAQSEAVVDELRALAAPLLTHARSEEDTLFPALADDEAAAGPVRVLTEEHALIEGWLDRFAPHMTASEMRSLFDAFESTLRGHIVREDDVLFPMAEQALGDERLRELEEATAGARV